MQFKRVLNAHAAVVHAIFMNWLQPFIEKALGHLTYTLEDFRRSYRTIIIRLGNKIYNYKYWKRNK